MRTTTPVEVLRAFFAYTAVRPGVFGIAVRSLPASLSLLRCFGALPLLFLLARRALPSLTISTPGRRPTAGQCSRLLRPECLCASAPSLSAHACRDSRTLVLRVSRAEF